MALSATTMTMAAGVNYTATTDSSTDWSAVTNNSYFYDKTTKLTYYKTSSGVVVGAYDVFNGGTITGLTINGTLTVTGNTSLQNLTATTISATTYLNLPNGYYDTTGITTSQSITWDKTYWGVSGLTTVDIILPSTTSKDGYSLIIKDEGGIAGTYRIRVTPASGLIDGNTYIDMNINYMSLTFVARNNNWWII